MFMKELRDAKDYVERAKSIFLDAVSEPDRDNAMILIGLGRRSSASSTRTCETRERAACCTSSAMVRAMRPLTQRRSPTL
jgi:hypothetical protein